MEETDLRECEGRFLNLSETKFMAGGAQQNNGHHVQ